MPSARMNASNIAAPRTTASKTILAFTDCPFDSVAGTARPGGACCSPGAGRSRLVLCRLPASLRAAPGTPEGRCAVRQHGRVGALAPQYRVPGPWRGPVENRLRQLGPGAVAAAGEVPQPGDEDAPAQFHSVSRTGARSLSGSHQSRLAAYHSAVARRPSLKAIAGSQPSSRRSFAQSSR